MRTSSMFRLKVSLSLLVAAVGQAISGQAVAQFSFELLPSTIPAGGGFNATFGVARGISGNGQVIVGSTADYANERAVVWRREASGWTQSFLPMETSANGRASGRAVAASYDGSTIVGSTGGVNNLFIGSTFGNSYVEPAVPAVWRSGNSASPTLELPIALGGSVVGNATGVSASGHAIAIVARTQTPTVQATRLGRLVNNTITYITPESPTTFESANVASYLSSSNMSSDGNTIAGARRVGNDIRAFRWTEAGGIEDLAVLPNGTSAVTSISGDGTVVGGMECDVGIVTTPVSGFTWRDGSATRRRSGFNSQITGVSSNGFYATGFGGTLRGSAGTLDMFSGSSITYATIFEGSRLIDLEFYLRQNGVDLGGHRLLSANAITPDGRTIIGVCTNGSGPLTSFIATIPTPGATLPLLAGVALVAVRRRR